jgi:hypothetical protein
MSSCPTKQNAINKIREKLLELSSSNPLLSKETQDINDALGEGMSSFGGKRRRYNSRKRRSSKMRHNKKGGMPPPRQEENLTEDEKNTLLNAISHIIAVGTIIGGTGALTCYITPAIEAYLIAMGWLPGLCKNSIEWGFRSIVGNLLPGVETCMAVQTRYNAIITQIIAAVGLPSGAGILLKRQAILGGYSTYKNAIYNILKSTTDNIRSMLISRRSTEATPTLSKEEINRITDEVIEREFNLTDMTPEQASELKKYQKEVEELERQAREEEEEDEYSGMPHSWGGKKRRTMRKHKSSKRKSSKKLKRKHRTRKHRTRKH